MRPTLYIDIETIPGPEAGRDAIEISAPAQYKKPESIQQWLDENGETARDEIYRRQALNGGYGQVCAIAWSLGDAPIGDVAETRDDESRLLRSTIDMIGTFLPHNDQPDICGHYVAGFDLRFLKQRCIIHGIKMPHWLARDHKPWEIRDTMTLWAGAKDRIGLDELCAILGVEGKGDMDGSKIYDAWKEARFADILAYCKDDVRRVMEIDSIYRKAGL